MNYRIKLKEGVLGRETTLGWSLTLAETIDEAQRRLDWKAATRARVVDLDGREVWRGAADGSRRQRLWLWGEAALAALGLAGIVAASLVDAI
ncbi:hypothetical protein [Reyranella sp.]|uniref:hypothetical protein n=1 Tax=Reyranella sp. TaxID=1929291 RepID=UPI00272FF2D6|nr:hypothetical protein [Reyranella sp.]MDP2372554.1 hypothetical protein [Reyranella sp.]